MSEEQSPKTKFNLKRFLPFFAKAIIGLYLVISAVLIAGLWVRLTRVEARVFPRPAFGSEDVLKVAKQMGLNTKEFQACMKAKDVDSAITEDFQSGQAAGIQGTPGTVLVNLKTNQAVRLNGGAMPYEALKSIIDDYIAGKSIEEINAPYDAGGTGTEIVSELATYAPITENDAIRGGSSAKFALIEYSDLECPYCIRFHPTVKDLLSFYKDDMLWVYRHFPLTSIHANAQMFAEAAECAKLQGGDEAFWQMTDTIFSAQSSN